MPTAQSPATQLPNPTPPREATSEICGLTVLRTKPDRCATKKWNWNPKLREWSVRAYDAGAWFVPREYGVRNLRELVEVLEAVRRDPRALVVRGALTPHVRYALAKNSGFEIRRRKHPQGKSTPALVEVPRRWLMADIDGWIMPQCADLIGDPEKVIDTAIRDVLPPAFHDAEC